MKPQSNPQPNRTDLAPGRDPARLLVPAATALLAGGLAYFAAELVTAAAWSDPPYDWAANLVPDLGNTSSGPYQDRIVSSPLHAVMNAGFITQGVLYGTAAGLLSRVVTGRSRSVLAGLGVTYAAGLVVVGLVPQSSGISTPALVTHFVGAGLAILAGPVITIVASLRWRRLGLPRWFARLGVGLGAATLVVGNLLLVTQFGPPGLRERISIDPYVLWQIAAGAVLLVAARRRARAERAT